jgi:transposase
MTEHTIGIDVSKDHLDAHKLPDGIARQFANTPAGIKTLIGWIGPDPARIVFEPTGAYHRQLEMRLAEAGLPIVKVNPRQAKRFDQAIGQLAKTDRLDAAMLARMGALLDLQPRPVPTANQRDLKDLHVAREALIKDRTAAANRAKTLLLPVLKRQNNARGKQIDIQLAEIDAAIMALIKADPELARKLAVLTSIPGIAAITAAMLISEMPELGTLDEKQIAALAGLAPIARQSGKWSGKAFVQGGRKKVRNGLYMPALVAMRYNPDLKAKYQALTARGKAPKQAITAVMRKLLIIANALLRKGSHWQNRLA